MKILVASASKHASTFGIAEAIAAELRMMRYEVDVAPVDNVLGVRRYDAVILGSAVYMGKWLPEATAFIEDHKADLREKPVWLFSSGPLGWDEPGSSDGPAAAAELVAAAWARGHRAFAGKLDKHELGLVERLTVRAVRAPEGDFRDWSAIRSWAREIGDSLAPRPTTAAATAAFADEA